MNHPGVTHLVGVSIPRAGHHYLVRLMQEALGPDLRYCEFYVSLDCCRQVPCRRRDSARIIFQKNHDHDLKLNAELAHCLYVVQTRQPLLEALSDRELAEVVRPELKGDLDDLAVWLGKKAAYYQLFHRKWIVGAPANCVHIPYETLLKDPAGVLHELFLRAGIPVAAAAIDAAVARQAAQRNSVTMGPFKPRELKIEAAARPLFEAFEDLLADKFGHAVTPGISPAPAPAGPGAALGLAAHAHAAVMMRDWPAAAAGWEKFCEAFPDNAYGHIEQSLCAEALGDQRGALTCALQAARQIPARLEAMKRARDLLHTRGRFKPAGQLAAAIAERTPDRPLALIDLADDLFQLNRMAEAVEVARRFVAVASALPLDGFQTDTWPLRCNAYGFNDANFWAAASRILLTGGATELGLEAAQIACAMSGGAADHAALVAHAQHLATLSK